MNSRRSKMPKTGHFINFVKLTSLTFSWSHYLVSKNDLLFLIKFHITPMHNSLLFGAATRDFIGSWRIRFLVIRRGNYFQRRGTRRIARQHDIVDTDTQGRTFASSPAWTVKNSHYAFNVSYRWRTLEIKKSSISQGSKAQLLTIKYLTIRSSLCLNSNNIATI